MPSPKLARLQDEAATVTKEIEALRSLEAKDEADAKDIEARLNEAMTRSEAVTAAAKREQDLDARLASLRAVTSDSEPRSAVKGEKKPAVKRATFGGDRVTRGRFETAEDAEGVGIALRDLAHGRIEMRDEMGETSPTYDGKGADYIQGQLYSAVVNTVNYNSVGLQLAFSIPTSSNAVTLPKAGDITVDIVDENTETDPQALSTDKSTVYVYDYRAEVPVSNNLLEDSPVAVANLIVQKGGTGFARKFDGVWLGGHTGKSITGLAAAVSEARTLELGADDDLTSKDVAELIGMVEDVINETAWVVSGLGWAELMKVYAAQLGSMTVGGGRIVPTVMGSPVFKVKGLPEGVLGLYGDFASASAIAYKPAGLQITALREIGARKNQTVFNMIQRVGILNHDSSFVAKLTRDAG